MYYGSTRECISDNSIEMPGGFPQKLLVAVFKKGKHDALGCRAVLALGLA
jgi:hypothetical protein